MGRHSEGRAGAGREPWQGSSAGRRRPYPVRAGAQRGPAVSAPAARGRRHAWLSRKLGARPAQSSRAVGDQQPHPACDSRARATHREHLEAAMADFDWSILERPRAMAMVGGQLGFSWMVLADALAELSDEEWAWEPAPGAWSVRRRADLAFDDARCTAASGRSARSARTSGLRLRRARIPTIPAACRPGPARRRWSRAARSPSEGFHDETVQTGPGPTSAVSRAACRRPDRHPAYEQVRARVGDRSPARVWRTHALDPEPVTSAQRHRQLPEVCHLHLGSTEVRRVAGGAAP